jgi:putative ABC transport system substrate-binding protein
MEGSESMKMFSKKMVRMVALAAAMALVAGCGGEQKKEAPKAAESKNVKVGIVQLVEHPALDAANKGFVEGLASRGYKEGKNITFDRQNAQADQSNLQTIAQRFVNNKVNLICAIATPAAQTVANATKDIPIVGTAITDYEQAKLVKSNAKSGTNVTGTSDMNPIKEQIDLLMKLVPKAKTIGFIYSSSEVNSQIQIKAAKQYAESKGLKTMEATVSTVNDIQQAANSLVGKVDALYIPTDNVLASAMPTLTTITTDAKIPVICGEGNMVKAGGLATLAIDYHKLGFQAGIMAADILDGKKKVQDMGIETQKEFQTVINEEIAKKIGVTIPADLLKKAQEVKK